MIDHAYTKVFDFHSQASSPSCGKNGNGHKQIQDTIPFDDTMVLDSHLVETHSEKLDFEAQVVDDSDCFEDKKVQSFCGYENEVVPDSEDEGVCRTKTLGPDNLLSDGSKGCGVTVERTDKQEDFGIDSQQPGESSQAGALEFVDQFLSLSMLDLSPEHPIKKTVGEKSLSLSSGMGPRSLSKRMKFRKIPITKIGTSEWAYGDLHGKDDVFSKRMKASFEFGDIRQESVMGYHKAMCVNGEGGRSSCSEHDKKKELVNLPKEIAGPTHSDSRILKHNPRDNFRIEHATKMKIKDLSIKEFNEQLHAESSDQQLCGCSTGIDTPDLFDVGVNTQIAAEAMEALSYAPFTSSTVFNADQGPLNATNNSPKGVIMNKARSEQAFIKTSDFSGLGGFATKSKQRKHTARKSFNNSNKEPGPGLSRLIKVRRGKSFLGEQIECMNSANTNGSGNGSHRLIIKGHADGTVGRNNKECENHTTSSILVDQEEGLKNITVAQESRQSSAGDALRRTKKQSDNPRDWTEDGIITDRRKRSRLTGNPTKFVSATGRWPALHSNSLAEAKNNILSQEKVISQEVTPMTSYLNLAMLNHPKGKRTLRSHLNRAINIHVDFGTLIGKEGNRRCMTSQRRAKDIGNTSCYEGMKEKPQSAHSISAQHLPEKDLMSLDEPGSAVVLPNYESAIISAGISPAEMDDFNFPMFSKVTGKNHNFGVSAGKNLEPPNSGYICTVNFIKATNAASSSHVPSKYNRKPFNKSPTKSSLLKELIRLDVPGSRPPDFTWKDLRRRRDMTHVRVLFSQHLDDDVIKQQKKISARLGISIATCPRDATHFIADRFVRTRNMLETIALGKPVVTHLWLESCGQASCLIDEKNYILRDAKKEKEIGFSMPVTYIRSSQHPLLKGQRVFITQSIKPSTEMISSLVKLVQGQVVEISQVCVVKELKFHDNPLILSCEEDHAICVPFLDKGLAAYSSELLLNGIVVQKFEFERHQLFKDLAKRYQCSTKSRRGKVCLKRSL